LHARGTDFWNHCDGPTGRRHDHEPGAGWAFKELGVESREVTNLGFRGKKESIQFLGAHCNLCPDGALLELYLLEPALDLSHRINSIVCHSRGFWSVLRQV
jgi:hypothetical protein